MNSYDMNWDEMAEQANNVKGKHEYAEPQKSVFLKVPAGMHQLRIVPTGNALEKLPYIKIVQHQANYKDENGSFRFGFVLCWKGVMDNLTNKKTEEAKKHNSHISHLYTQGALDQVNYKLYAQHGCPFCKANQYLHMQGADKAVTSKFWPNESYNFNVIWRPTNNSGDDGIYIWKLSKQKFNLIINSIKIAKFEIAPPVDLLHPEIGQDILMQAEGQGLARRYPIIQFMGMPKPLNLGDRVPHDLTNMLIKSYKPYQESVNLMKKWFGKILMNYGYTIPGDAVLQEQYQEVNEFVSNQVMNQINEQRPKQTHAPIAMTSLPQEAVTPGRKYFANGMYEENGMLYKSDGVPAF